VKYETAFKLSDTFWAVAFPPKERKVRRIREYLNVIGTQQK
jgi:hypothetical protein